MRMSVLALLSMLFICAVCCIAQTTAADSNGSISGRVTIGGKGAAGISVVARVGDSPLDNRTAAKTTTDEEGNYRLAGLAAGHFTINPIAKAYVVAAGEAYKQPTQSVNVAENESIKNIDFALVRGGVITGRITDLEGRPIIGERVNVATKGESGNDRPIMMLLPGGRNQTDDRGVYRIYGLAPGSYKVSIGATPSASGGVSIMGMGGSQYTKTYYPGVSEESKATAIELNEGTEARNIDITPGKSARGFSVSGRVVDADSGQPVATAFIGYSSVNAANQQLGAMNFTGIQTDANGKFRLEGIQPGHYAAFMMGIGQENSSYSDPAPFDISDVDVTGIEIKVRRGATIEGVAVIENNADPAAAALLQSVSLIAYTSVEKSTTAPSYSRGNINADGSFRFAGLAPGKVQIRMMVFGAPSKGPELVRTELNGLDQPEGIEITAGAHITGVRLVFGYGTGKIRGEVKIEGGVLPQGTTLMVSFHAAGSAAQRPDRFLEVDARGRFVIENLPAGTYELTLRARTQAPMFEPVTRTVTVANGAEEPVTIVIDLAKKKAGSE